MKGNTLIRRKYNDGWLDLGKRREQLDTAPVYTLMRLQDDDPSVQVQYAIVIDYGTSTSLYTYHSLKVAFNTYRLLATRDWSYMFH